MEEQTQWFFSWNAFDTNTWEYLPEYSYGEVYMSDVGRLPNEIYNSLMAEKEKLRENLRIQCIAFNKL